MEFVHVVYIIVYDIYHFCIHFYTLLRLTIISHLLIYVSNTENTLMVAILLNV